jgi:hypothetical protein
LIIANCLGQAGLYCALASTLNMVTIDHAIGSSTDTLTDSTAFVDNNNNGSAGIVDLTNSAPILSQSDAFFDTYNMKSNTAPVFDSISLPQGGVYRTSSGTLDVTFTNFDSAGLQEEFLVLVPFTPGPEPGSFVLMLAGALTLAGLLLRRRKTFGDR